MPTGTWERLAPTRRDSVTAAAEHEFATRGFSQGSLNTIASEAGVAKGSLFQYFEDKVDLFAYVASLASVRIRAHMEKIAADLPWDTDFFGSIRGLNEHWVTYFYEHPVDLALTAAANLEPDRLAREAVRSSAADEYRGMMAPLLELATANRQFKEGADTDALLAMLLLLFPHIALAPHINGLDQVLGIFGTEPLEAAAGSDRLLKVLELAYRR